jgi:VanZ family protein
MSSTPAARVRPAGPAWLTLGYVALLAYGTLYPLSGWRLPPVGLTTLFAASLHMPASRADLLTNLLVYLPLGLLIGLRRREHGPAGAVGRAALAGLALSTALECLQAFLPERTPSLLDVGLNGAGAGAGALLPFLVSRDTRLGDALARWRRDRFRDGALADLGLVVLALWALAQLSPLVPSIDLGNLRSGLSPLWRTLNEPARLDPGVALAYLLSVLVLGWIARDLWRAAPRQFPPVFAVFVAGVLALKVPVMTRQVSLEAVLAAALALAALRATTHWRAPLRWRASVAALVAAYAVEQLRPALDPNALRHAFSWDLFAPQMRGLDGFADILAVAWVFVAAAYLARRRWPAAGLRTGVLAAAGVAAFALALEWSQQYLPGRYGEVSDVLVAVLAWLAAWSATGASKRPAGEAAR